MKHDSMIRCTFVIVYLPMNKQIKYIDFILYFTIVNIFDYFRYEDISDNTGIKVLKSPIQFEPPELDFKEQ